MKKNATGRRRLTSSNRATIFVTTSCEKRHNKLFGYKLGESTENNKAPLFFSGKKTIQTLTVPLSHYAVFCEVINM